MIQRARRGAAKGTPAITDPEIRCLIEVYFAAAREALRKEFESIVDGEPVPARWLAMAGINRKKAGAPGYPERGMKCAQHAIDREAGRAQSSVVELCRGLGIDERQYRRDVAKYGPILRREYFAQWLSDLSKSLRQRSKAAGE